MTGWAEQGIQGKTICQALARNHRFGSSYSSVYRFIRALGINAPKATKHLDFAPGEAVQADFGAGAVLVGRHTGEEFKTWFFLMALCWNRHQYAELILNQNQLENNPTVRKQYRRPGPIISASKWLHQGEI